MKNLIESITESNTNVSLEKVNSKNWPKLDVVICTALGNNIHFYGEKKWISDYRLAKVMSGAEADKFINSLLDNSSKNNGYVFDIPANPMLWESAIMLAYKNADETYAKYLSKLAKDFHILEK